VAKISYRSKGEVKTCPSPLHVQAIFYRIIGLDARKISEPRPPIQQKSTSKTLLSYILEYLIS
jgi:hypothetical protein